MKRTATVASILVTCTSLISPFQLHTAPMGSPNASLLMNSKANEKLKIAVNNRILAKVHGKPITVVDVQKKMDVVFYGRFPEYADSVTARHQFYTMSWKQILQDLIDRELILEDAKAAKMEVTRSEVRQDIEQQFGPNVIARLDKLGMTMQEAHNMVEGDIILNRMIIMKTRTKAAGKVNPGILRKAYQEYSQTHRRATEWTYQLISIRHPDESKGEAAARVIAGLLNSQQLTPEQLTESVQQLDVIDNDTKVSVSEDYVHDEDTASEAYQSILTTLRPGQFSLPQAQQSRRSQSTVHRIFYLKEMEPGGAIPFVEVEDMLYNELMGKTIEAESELYLEKLRKDAGMTQAQGINLPEGFEPFVLK